MGGDQGLSPVEVKAGAMTPMDGNFSGIISGNLRVSKTWLLAITKQ